MSLPPLDKRVTSVLFVGDVIEGPTGFERVLFVSVSNKHAQVEDAMGVRWLSRARPDYGWTVVSRQGAQTFVNVPPVTLRAVAEIPPPTLDVICSNVLCSCQGDLDLIGLDDNDWNEG